MVNQLTKFNCTDCGEYANPAYCKKYVAGYGFIVHAGETVCDMCLFKREVRAGLREVSHLSDVKKAS